jgi:hypothetical protein
MRDPHGPRQHVMLQAKTQLDSERGNLLKKNSRLQLLFRI